MKTLTEEYYDHILEGVDYGKVKNTVFKIIYDMSDRRGLKQEWEQIDEDIQCEIIQQWIDIVEANCI